jgi:hypothetical protein
MFQQEPKFDTYDYAIGGKMVVGKARMSYDYKLMLEDGDEEAKKRLKNDLIQQMAMFILENNLVEFTYYDDPVTFDRQIAVRAYLAPNDQVKILRVVNKIV